LLLASRDPASRDLADQLQRARLTLSQRLLRPLRDAEANQAEVQRRTDAKEELEKRLAAQLRLAPPPAADAPRTPQRLSDRLPAGSCFLDLYRYFHVTQDPHIKGKKGEKWTVRYVAFVVRPGKEAARVELGDADPIERAWAAWRQAITARQPDEAAE